MATRLRLYDVRMSRLPGLLGICASDTAQVANWVNTAQRRLLTCREAGNEGWNGTFAEVAFTLVSRNNPFITCPRQIARLEKLVVCKHAVWIQNQFYEYLDFGNGRMPQLYRESYCLPTAFERNNVITFSELPFSQQVVRIYSTDPVVDSESAARVLLQGEDQNSSVIYTQDGDAQVQGEYVIVDDPFGDSLNSFKNPLSGIQKDVTSGTLQFFAVDPSTGDETMFHTMEPGEQVAGYKRYYLNHLPQGCCLTNPVTTTLQVSAIAKLELVPVVVDQDYLLLTSLEAIIEECQSIRYSEMDSERAEKLSLVHHQQAVRYLQGELVHLYGKDHPATNFAPFGTARLCRQKIGNLI